MIGTIQAVHQLIEEGFDITKSRLESLIATGKINPPAMVGTSRVWTESDLKRVRKVLQKKGGEK